jgi:hypothetical protein
VTVYGAVVCTRCHPPVNQGLVKEWHRLLAPGPESTTPDVEPLEPPAEGIALAMRIGGHLESLPEGESATAAELAKALFGPAYTLDNVIEISKVTEQLRQARILIAGRDACGGYQLAVPASCEAADAPPGNFILQEEPHAEDSLS